MQTHFTLAQLEDADVRDADAILRACVHCGFCTATCPTYVLLGDERDSPRGRIYMIKDMLESGRPATQEVVTHLDRCLTCYGCMTTCPSGVDYRHLVDHGRHHVAETYHRRFADRAVRRLLGAVLPYPGRFRAALLLARLTRPFRAFVPAALRPLLKAAGKAHAGESPVAPGVYPAEGDRRMRIALLTGCVQQVLAPEIGQASLRLLRRLGCEVVVPKAAGCCGGLAHHMGLEANGRASAAANVSAWETCGPLDAIVADASGCGAVLKDYGFLLRGDVDHVEAAEQCATRAKDVTEIVETLGLGASEAPRRLAVAVQTPCTLQHGQRITQLPKRLLRACGFEVREPAEPHLCCGSAGTYSLLQPELSRPLRDRKAAALDALEADVIASGNVGCLAHLSPAVGAPVVHTVQLLDWATGGPAPRGLAAR